MIETILLAIAAILILLGLIHLTFWAIASISARIYLLHARLTGRPEYQKRTAG